MLDNDFDFEGDTLTVTPGVSNGTYGTLTLNSDGTYNYVLNANAQTLAQGEIGQDSFTYTVSDGSASDTANLVFNITGLNDAPVANPDSRHDQRECRDPDQRARQRRPTSTMARC